jgi:hypothetical protein
LPLALSILMLMMFAASALAQTSATPAAPNPQAQTTQAPSAEILKKWREGMKQVPVSKQGCFTSSYPSTQWQEVPCTTAPNVPYLPRSGTTSPTVGNGNDVSLQVTGLISLAEGSFTFVDGVTSETGQVGGQGGQVADVFSLQLNSNFFNGGLNGTPACNGARNPAACQGWEQFVYSNGQPGTNGFAFIQWWLINYATTCPSGWNTSGSNCWTNAPSTVSVPRQVIANLTNLSVTGTSFNSDVGFVDEIIFSTGSNLYATTNPGNILNLYQFWNAAEFNIVGDCCASQANFNNGSTLNVSISAVNGTPLAPSCNGQGFTGETNNLSFGNPPIAHPLGRPSVVFTESTAGGVTSACQSAVELPKRVTPHDFNADSISDVLWYNTSGGQVVNWLLNGASVIGGGSPGAAGSPWGIVGQRDFNNDGSYDLLWRNGTTGQLLIWFLNGSSVIGGGSPGSAANPWFVAGAGDFNGDGFGDVLWYNATTGQVVLWFLNGTSVIGGGSPGVTGGSWTVAGVGDFNGDGRSDIVWYNTSSGQVVIWFMNGATVIGGGPAQTFVPTDWTIAGTGDFNADGKSDILWRNHTTGQLLIWFLHGSSVIAVGSPGSAASPWTITETGDFNGDGKSDLLWSNTVTGQLVVWLLNDALVIGGGSLGGAASPWLIQSVNSD